MDVFEAVELRIACRWFLDKPVDAKIVRDVITRAARAASGGNLQSWQVYALAGAPLAELKRKVAAHIAGRDPRHDDAEYPIYPKTMWEPTSRAARSTACSFTARSISPATMPRGGSINTSAILNSSTRRWRCSSPSTVTSGPASGRISAAISTLWRSSPAATASIPARRIWARMHRIVGAFVTTPPEQMLFCAVAIGYGDHGHPANSFRSPRAELAEFCRFFGFE